MFSPASSSVASQAAAAPLSARSSLAWSSAPLSIPTRALSCQMVDVATQTEPVYDLPPAPCRAFTGTATAPRYCASRSELPNEIWGEIANFSLRNDILNLRTVNRDVRMQADRMITELTLRSSQALIDFAYTDGFKHIKTLHLRQTDGAALILLANRLTTHPRSNLVIDIAECHVGLFDALLALGALSLGALRLKGVYVTPEVVGALAESTFPITLTGYMTREELMNAARIPTLVELAVSSAQFSDDVALSFTAHPALQRLSFPVNQSFSSTGLSYLAAMPDLRSLRVYDTVFMANAISATTARRLAAQGTLESLSIQTRMEPLSDACLSALSNSRTLKSLGISLSSGIHHVTRMAALEHLTLDGSCFGSRPMDVPTAHLIGAMPTLNALQLERITFHRDAFRTLIWHLRAETLSLTTMSVEEDGVVALLANTQLTSLSFVDVRIAPAHLVALCQHATLERLTIDGVACRLADAR